MAVQEMLSIGDWKITLESDRGMPDPSFVGYRMRAVKDGRTTYCYDKMFHQQGLEEAYFDLISYWKREAWLAVAERIYDGEMIDGDS